MKNSNQLLTHYEFEAQQLKQRTLEIAKQGNFLEKLSIGISILTIIIALLK